MICFVFRGERVCEKRVFDMFRVQMEFRLQRSV